MFPTQRAKMVKDIWILILIAAVSFFFLTTKLPETEFVTDSIESIEKSEDTVMRFSAVTLSASLAITAFPDDFATPLAENLADMNFYFILILMLLHLEKLLVVYGLDIAFAYVIPAACAIGLLAIALKRDVLKSLAMRVAILGLAVALVVPCSTHITNYVAADLNEYVESTIVMTEEGTNKLNEATEGAADEQTVFERLSVLFETAIDGISDMMVHLQNTIRKCMKSIAIMLLTNCLMPIMNFFILRWVLKETFHIAIPVPQPRRQRKGSDSDPGSGTPGNELIAEGE